MKQLLLSQPRLWICVFCMFSTIVVSSQTITGKITDESKQPMSGVSVIEKGTTSGVTSKSDGTFSIASSSSKAVLVFSFVGYITNEVVVGNQTAVDIVLVADDIKKLDQVVVVGYGTQRKKDLTGSVASIKGEAIRQVPSQNAIKSMQGMVAGVDIASPNNDPNSSPVIRIRGNRSINAGNDPLIVIDGLPFGGSLNDLNSGDIRSIDVLKDASATAIYGSRGANGVILITTNRGTANKVQVGYNGYYGVQSPIKKLPLKNGAEYAEFRREAERNANRYNSSTPSAALDELMFYYRNSEVEKSVLGAYDASGNYDPSKVRDFDWIDAVTRTGTQQEHQLSILSGTDKSQTSFSLGYYNNKGVVKGFDYKRYNMRLTYDNQIFKAFKIGGTIAVSINKSRTTDNLYNLGGQVNPLSPIRDSAGDYIVEPASDPLTFNPLIRLEGAFSEAVSNRFYGNFFAELGLTKGLKYRLSFSPDYRFVRTGSFRNSAVAQGGPASASNNTSQPFHYVLDNMITYDKRFASEHKINVTLLQSIEKDRFESVGGSARDLPYEQQLYYNLGTANEITGLNSNLSEWSLSSFMARVNYGFKDKYLLTLTGRYDGSSRLAPRNKWDFFPSAAFAWNASDETFIQNLNVFSDLKLRLSYGLTGNTAIDPYQTQGGLARTLYATGNLPAFGYQPNLITNPDLGWEKTKQANLGIDFGVLNNRLTGTVDLYLQNTTDLLLARQLPTASGFSSIIENIGATRNKGIELSLRGVLFDNPKSKLRWVNQITFTKNKEAIVSLYSGKVDDVGNRWFIGYPVTTYFDYKKTGIFQDDSKDAALITQYNSNGGTFAKGEIKIQDTNGDGKIDASDRVILGSAVPKWYGSLNSTLEYASFDLNFLLFARQGQTINDDQGILYEGRENWLKVDYWTPTNPTNEFPRPVSGRRGPLFGNTLAYQDGSFVRLRNITLGYKLPETIQRRLHTTNFRIYVSALNPILITDFRGIDPEGSTGITTPSVKTFMTGINITF
ncbi:MAG: SusC/RagA family TonB-linked outer membrane protein [Chitinophagaceae bacterium]